MTNSNASKRRPGVQPEGLVVSGAPRRFSRALLLTVAVLAVGCGGGPTGGGPVPGTPPASDATTSTVTVRVTWPSGVSVPASLSVDTAWSSVAVAGGTASVTTFARGQGLAAVVGGQTPLLLGFVSADRPAVSARTTAEALLFYRLGGPFLEPALQAALLDRLAVDARVASLAATIEQDLRGARTGLRGSAVQAALTAAAATFGARAPQPQSVSVNPDTQASGLAVRETAPLQDEVKVYNAFRRPVHVFVERLNPNPAIVSDFALDAASVTLPDSASRLVNFLAGPSGNGAVPREWSASAPVALPPARDATGDVPTSYRFTIVGAGHGAPSGTADAARLAKARELARRTALEVFFIPTIGAALGVGGREVRAEDFGALFASVSPGNIAALESGDFAAGLAGAYRDLFSSAALPATVSTVLRVYYPAVRPEARADVAQRLSRALAPLVSANLDARWSGALNAIGQSRRAEVFTVTTRPVRLRVTPSETTLGTGGEVTLTAALQLPQGDAGNDVTYRWTLADTGGNVPAGFLSENGQGRPNTFTTPGKVMRYQHRFGLNVRYGTDVVTVEALRGGDVIARGSARVTVKSSAVTLTPRAASLQVGARQAFAANVDPLPTIGTVRYVFSTFGSADATFTTGSQVQSGTASSATLMVLGDSSPTATVKVMAFLDRDGTLTEIGEATARIDVSKLAVRLDPPSAEIDKNGTVSFRANVPDVRDTFDFFYRFTNTGRSGVLREGAAGRTSNDLCTANSSVTYAQQGDTLATDTVAVAVYAHPRCVGEPLGRASASVTVREAGSLRNGDFSQGFNFWTITGPRVRVETSVSYGCLPEQTGNPFAFLDVHSNRRGSISQTFKVPADARRLKFRTWTNLDPVTVTLTFGNAVLDTFVPPSLHRLSNPRDLYSVVCTGARPISKTYDVSRFAGQTVTLTLSAAGPGINGTITNFDDFVIER